MENCDFLPKCRIFSLFQLIIKRKSNAWICVFSFVLLCCGILLSISDTVCQQFLASFATSFSPSLLQIRPYSLPLCFVLQKLYQGPISFLVSLLHTSFLVSILRFFFLFRPNFVGSFVHHTHTHPDIPWHVSPKCFGPPSIGVQFLKYCCTLPLPQRRTQGTLKEVSWITAGCVVRWRIDGGSRS